MIYVHVHRLYYDSCILSRVTMGLIYLAKCKIHPGQVSLPDHFKASTNTLDWSSLDCRRNKELLEDLGATW